MGDNFYADLQEITSFSDVVSLRAHRDVPDDWYVVITDVKGSTEAIENGRYRDVNALGVASILALRNAVPEVSLPFVFGGDGATLLLPASVLDRADTALRGVRVMAKEAFEMDLRVARVPVKKLRSSGATVRVARFRQSEHVALAAFSGQGYSVAERWIKDPELSGEYVVGDEGPAEADFSGFECRWQPVPAKKGKVVSLLVVAVGDTSEQREKTYAEVLRGLEDLEALSTLPPFEQNQMKLRSLWGDYSTEARVCSRQREGAAFRKAHSEARTKSLIGKMLLVTKRKAGGFDGKRYREDFLKNTDHRKFDEALRMVLDLDAIQRVRLESLLAPLNAVGRLAYGTHESDAALVTCMVGSYDTDHVHFADGADGGYALASKPLKARLEELGRMSRFPATS